MKQVEFCNKCCKPKNYPGRDKHLVSVCECEKKKGGNKKK